MLCCDYRAQLRQIKKESDAALETQRQATTVELQQQAISHRAEVMRALRAENKRKLQQAMASITNLAQQAGVSGSAAPGGGGGGDSGPASARGVGLPGVLSMEVLEVLAGDDEETINSAVMRKEMEASLAEANKNLEELRSKVGNCNV